MSFPELFAAVINWVNNTIWSAPFLIFVIVIGVYFFFGSGLFTIRHFGHIMKYTFGNVIGKNNKDSSELQKKEGQISPFEAVCIAIGGCVGTGNIAGVASSIAVGGPGSIFWLWVWAFLGMMVKMVEVTLACHYRSKNEKGEYYGGGTYYIEKGLGRQKKMPGAMALAVLFAIGFIAQFLGGSQAYSISETLNVSFGINMLLVTFIYTVVLYWVIWKGTGRVAKVATRLVPFMCVLFMIGGVMLIIANIANVPHLIYQIFHDAFTGSAAVGGFVGSTVSIAVREGVARSINSNEAGQGSSPLVHGSANTIHPVREGLWGAFEVFTDTIIVCSITALAVLASGAYETGLGGATLTIAAFETVFGAGADWFIGIMCILFGITTTGGWFLYYISVIQWLFRKHPVTRDRLCYLFKFVFPIPNMVIVWAITSGGYDADLFWAIVNVTLILPVFSNLLALFLLRKKFWELLKDYKARYMGIGKVDPNFYVFYEDDPEVFAQEEAFRQELKKIDEQALAARKG